LLDRLREALESERRWSANVAHELRTPVAELHSLAEVGGLWPDDPETNRLFFDDAKKIAARMARTVDTLLELQRSESEGEPYLREEFEVSQRFRESVAAVATAAEGREIDLVQEYSAVVRVESDPYAFDLIAANILQNAVTYAPSGDTITCRVERRPSGLEVTVENRARELEAADVDRLFERFWRKDAARTSGRAGLGLALVAELARRLGLQTISELDSQGRLKIGVRFPF
jgi:two-component system sensor histidine kinase QseC